MANASAPSFSCIDEFEFLDFDLDTQLAVLKAQYETDDIQMKYIDEEHDEVGIFNQEDYDYAIQFAQKSNGFLKIRIKNSKGDRLGVHNFLINLQEKENTDTQQKSSKTNDDKTLEKNDNKEINSTKKVIEDDLKNNTSIKLTNEQTVWLVNYLDQFKKEIINEMENKMKNLVLSQSMMMMNNSNAFIKDPSKNDESQLEMFVDDSLNENLKFEEKIAKLLDLVVEAKALDRPLKAAYIEEELKLTGAFCSIFVKDFTIPDGTKCEPNMKFRKTWSVRNTGKLAWDNNKFQVKLVCIAGNIIVPINGEFVDVANTNVGETTNISVDLIAPSTPGEYFSEWVLCCNNYQFGPRIWCTIEVVDNLIQLETTTPSSTILQEDMDDEFVVIPDCLNLNKKWKPSCKDLESNETRKRSECENLLETSYLELKPNDFNNKENEKEDSDENENDQTKSIESLNNTLETNLEVESKTNEAEIQNSKIEQEVIKNVENNETNINSVIVNEPEQSKIEPKQIKLIPLLPSISISTKTERKVEENNSTQQNNNNNTNPSNFNLMMDAFANVRGGPVCAGNVEFININQSQNNKSSSSSAPESASATASSSASATNTTSSSGAETFSPKSPVAVITNAFGSLGSLYQTGPVRPAPTQPETNQSKLISMGFADRKLNENLLKKYNDDINKVIQHLVDTQDQYWP